MKPKHEWSWYAAGKHPVAGDYFEIGSRDPMFQAFGQWAAGGYRKLGAARDKDNIQNSWRFWAKGVRKKHLMCGVGRDSCDSFGRSFPLVILGTGPLKNWEANWELLPVALENTWNRIEYLGAKRLLNLKQLEDEVQMLASPPGNWSELKTKPDRVGHNSPGKGGMPSAWRKKAQNLNQVSTQAFASIELGDVPLDDRARTIVEWHVALKERSNVAPNAIFMGGNFEKTYLVLFKRPLREDDFIQLWSMGRHVIKKNG
jgi:type VI secretion system protein VasJ